MNTIILESAARARTDELRRAARQEALARSVERDATVNRPRRPRWALRRRVA